MVALEDTVGELVRRFVVKRVQRPDLLMVSIAHPRERCYGCHDDCDICGQTKSKDGIVLVEVVLARHDHLVG